MLLLVNDGTKNLSEWSNLFRSLGVQEEVVELDYDGVLSTAETRIQGVRLALVLVSASICGWKEVAAHLREACPSCKIVCVFEGNYPALADHVRDKFGAKCFFLSSTTTEEQLQSLRELAQ